MKIKITQCFKALLVALMLSGTTAKTQTVSHDFKNTINNAFAGMDLSKVPHHLLTDYAMEFLDLRPYNGVASDTNYVHKGIFTAAYNTLLMARTQTNVADLIQPSQFDSNWQAKRSHYTIALSGLYYKYSSIRKNAHPAAITVVDDKLYDKYNGGVWQNPYETDQVFMMTAPILIYKYRNMKVTLPSNLWYTNQDSQVQSIQVNFNDGNGYQTITMGQTINLSYANAGTYDWDYKLTLSGGQVLYGHSKILVGDQTAPIVSPIMRTPTVACNPANPDNLPFDEINFQGTQQYFGSANSATIQIAYASGDFCDDITNPLIVAEGFESGLLGGENPLGDNDLDEFLDEIRRPSIPLRNEIANYDIIYVNWDQGRDDIRRNALLLQDIIKWVNDTKTTDSLNVVLGQSMGGIIARYALKDMEDRSMDHETKLYISHDAPHQGANLPLSIQYLARHMADQFVSTPVGDFNIPVAGDGTITLNDIQNVFNSTGTRQLLANNINGNLALDNAVFESWQTELQNKGYPQQTRNIAISNGSHCPSLQDIGPLQELLYLNGEVEPTILLDIIINQIPFLSFVENGVYVALAIILEDPAYLAGLLPGRTNFNMRFEAKTLPDVGQTANIYKGRIRITKKIDFLLFSLSYNINITDRERNNPSQVQLPFDSYHGGFFRVTFDLEDFNDSETNNWLYNLNLVGRSADFFNFIPTTSALDVGGGSVQLNNGDYLRQYNAENPPTGDRSIPFQNFTTSFDNSSNNEQHISFNTRNGDWLATELNTTTGDEEIFNCTFFCDNDPISGASLICTSANYSVDVLNANIIWSLNPSAAGSITVNSSSAITVNRAFGYSGAVTLTAAIDSPTCGAAIRSKNIHFGSPTGTARVTGDDDLNPSPTDQAFFYR